MLMRDGFRSHPKPPANNLDLRNEKMRERAQDHTLVTMDAREYISRMRRGEFPDRELELRESKK